MSTKVNTPKYILGVVMVALLVIGGWATTTARFSTKTKANIATAAKPVSASAMQGVGCGTAFEIDGDASDSDLAVNPPEDWDTVVGDGTGTIPRPLSTAVAATFVNDTGAGDRIYTGGSTKDFIDINQWQHRIGSVPDKDEIDDAFAALYTVGGQKFLYFGGDRHAVNGDAQIGFWFFQNAIAPITSGTNAGKFSGVHANGDLLILSTFTGGGGVPHLQIYKWVGTAGDGFQECTGGILDNSGTICDITAIADQGSALTNSVSVSSPWPYTPKSGTPNMFPPVAFFEGCLNLTDAGLGDECFSSFLLETRSSQSTDAVLKDFALGQFNTCVTIRVTKTVNDVCEGTATDYSYTAFNDSGVAVDCTLVDDPNTPGDPTDDFDVANTIPCTVIGATGTPTHFTMQPNTERTFTCSRTLSVGSHPDTVTFSATAFGDTQTATASATAHVFQNPAASAGPNQSVCELTAAHTFSLSGATATIPTGGSLTWSGSGITFSGPHDLNPTATVGAFGSFTATLTVESPSDQSPVCPPATSSLTLTLSQNPTASAGSNQSACETDPSHTFTLSGASATVPTGSTILWSGDGIAFSDASTIHPTATVSAFGTFTATLTVSNAASGAGCVPATSSLTLTLNQNPVITIADVACNAADGGTSLSLHVSTTAGGGDSFSWSGPSGGIVNGQGTDTIEVVKPGTYTVTVTNSSTTCSSMKSKNVGLCASDATAAATAPKPAKKRRQ